METQTILSLCVVACIIAIAFLLFKFINRQYQTEAIFAPEEYQHKLHGIYSLLPIFAKRYTNTKAMKNFIRNCVSKYQHPRLKKVYVVLGKESSGNLKFDIFLTKKLIQVIRDKLPHVTIHVHTNTDIASQIPTQKKLPEKIIFLPFSEAFMPDTRLADMELTNTL